MKRAFAIGLLGIAAITPSYAQLNLTAYRDPDLALSVTLRWNAPPDAVPPVTYELFQSTVFDSTYDFLTTIPADTSYTGAIPLLGARGFFYVVATDSTGTQTTSNVCGYVSFIAVGGPGAVSTPFGLPFRTWDVVSGFPLHGTSSSEPSDILGDQANCASLGAADRILRQDNGEFAIRNSASGCAWTQLLETNHRMISGRAYYYQNKTGIDRVVVIAGECDVVSMAPAITILNYWCGTVSWAYSWRDPRSRDRSVLQLLTAGFTGGSIGTSDRVLEQQHSGAFFYYRTSDNTWQGTLQRVVSGQAYWIQRKWLGSYNYTYDPASSAP